MSDTFLFWYTALQVSNALKDDDPDIGNFVRRNKKLTAGQKVRLLLRK